MTKNKKTLLLNLATIASALCISTTSYSAAFFQDSFESGDVSHTENGTRWGIAEAPRVVISNALAHTGSYSMRFRYAPTAPGADYTSEARFYFGTQRNEVYIRYYIYFPTNYAHRNDGGPTNNKFMILYQSGATYSTNPIVLGAELEQGSTAISNITGKGWKVGYPARLSYASGAYGYYSAFPQWRITSADLGKWLCFEWHFKRDSGAGDGAFQLWVDGVRVAGATNLSYEGASSFSGYFGEGYLMGWANSGFDQQTDFYIDDVVFSDSYIGPMGTGSSVSSPQLSVTSYTK